MAAKQPDFRRELAAEAADVRLAWVERLGLRGRKRWFRSHPGGVTPVAALQARALGRPRGCERPGAVAVFDAIEALCDRLGETPLGRS